MTSILFAPATRRPHTLPDKAADKPMRRQPGDLRSGVQRWWLARCARAEQPGRRVPYY